MRLLASLLAIAVLAGADELILKDQRVVEATMEVKEDGVVLKYPSGDVFVPAGLIRDYYRVDGDGAWVPVTPDERVRFAKGRAPWKGRWVSIKYREKMRLKDLEKRRLRLQQKKDRRLWRNRAEVKTRRFVFNHTLDDETFEEFKSLFETYYTFYRKYWKIRPAANFGKPVINIYHDEKYFLQVSGAPEGVAGYYNLLTRELHFYYDRERPHFTIDVMFHEGNHLLSHMIDKHFWYPWWISEGMAEYFGACEWNPETKEMKLGSLQSARLAVLQSVIEEDKWLDLETMIKAQRMGAVEYSWAWSFCHFLLSHPKYAKGFKKFYLALARDGSIKRVPIGLTFRAVEGDEQIEVLKRKLRIRDLEALEKEWYDYIKKNLSLERKDLNYGDAAWIMSLYGDNKRARKLFKKAIDKGSKDAFVHYGYAEIRYYKKRKVALKHAKLAVEYDPLHARAWALQGRCVLDEDREEGLRLLKLAREMAPDDRRIWFWAESAALSDDE